MKGRIATTTTAIAVGIAMRAYCSHADYISEANALFKNTIAFAAICFVIMIAYIAKETKNYVVYVRDEKAEKEKIEKFNKERNEFFDNYFKSSSELVK